MLAIFDFDGTLTTRDTFSDFIRFTFGIRRFIIGYMVFMPVILLYFLRLLDNDAPKKRLFKYFFADMTSTEFHRLCDLYSSVRLPSLINKRAYCRLRWHQSVGHKVIIVSASIQNWIDCWAEKQPGSLSVIATTIAIEEGVLTGRLSTKCVYGPEKVERLNMMFPVGSYNSIYAYGDSRGDRELLDFADRPYYRIFTK